MPSSKGSPEFKVTKTPRETRESSPIRRDSVSLFDLKYPADTPTGEAGGDGSTQPIREQRNLLFQRYRDPSENSSQTSKEAQLSNKESSTQDFEIISTQKSSAWSEINQSEATLSQSGDSIVSTSSWVKARKDQFHTMISKMGRSIKGDKQSHDVISETSHSTKGEQEIRKWAGEVHESDTWDTKNPEAAFEPNMWDRVKIDGKGVHPSTYARRKFNHETFNLAEMLRMAEEQKTPHYLINKAFSKLGELDVTLTGKGEADDMLSSSDQSQDLSVTTLEILDKSTDAINELLSRNVGQNLSEGFRGVNLSFDEFYQAKRAIPEYGNHLRALHKVKEALSTNIEKIQEKVSQNTEIVHTILERTQTDMERINKAIDATDAKLREVTERYEQLGNVDFLENLDFTLKEFEQTAPIFGRYWSGKETYLWPYGLPNWGELSRPENSLLFVMSDLGTDHLGSTRERYLKIQDPEFQDPYVRQNIVNSLTFLNWTAQGLKYHERTPQEQDLGRRLEALIPEELR